MDPKHLKPESARIFLTSNFILTSCYILGRIRIKEKKVNDGREKQMTDVSVIITTRSHSSAATVVTLYVQLWSTIWAV